MKNILVLCVTVALAYLTYDALQETPPPVAAAKVVAAPKVAPQEVYYHSPLDAPPMSTNQSTGMGYYSSSAESRFSGGALEPHSSYYVGGTTNIYPVYTNPSSRVNANTASPLTTQTHTQVIEHYPYRSTPAPLETAR